jgi:hypothetical protein
MNKAFPLLIMFKTPMSLVADQDAGSFVLMNFGAGERITIRQDIFFGGIKKSGKREAI